MGFRTVSRFLFGTAMRPRARLEPVRHDVRRSVVQSVRPPAEALAEIEKITAWAPHRIRVVLLAKGWLFLLW